MNKFWLVAKYELKRNMAKPGFIISILGFPITVLLIFTLTFFIIRSENKNAPVGYVDNAGFLTNAIPAPHRRTCFDGKEFQNLLPLITYSTEEEARAALDSRKIQAYYVISKDYRESNKVQLVYIKSPGSNATRQFWDFMQINKMRGMDPEKAKRAVSDFNMVVRWDKKGVIGAPGFSEKTILNNFIPMIFGIMFTILIFISSGYLMGAVVEEKGNRTMEIIVSSVSPYQLMGGKIAGIIILSLIQLLSWSTFAILFGIIGAAHLPREILQNLAIYPKVAGTILLLAIPAFIMFAGCLATVGSMSSEYREAQQMSMLFFFPCMIPIWLLKPILENPNGPISLFLSFFPLSSFTTMCVRVSFFQVPLWHVAVAGGILVICAVGSVWMASRVFRIGMLRYGKRLQLRDIFQVSRS